MIKKPLIALFSVVLLMLACQTFSNVEQMTEDSQAAFTQAAQTIQVQLTQSAAETVIAQLTRIAGEPSPMPPPATETLPPSMPTATAQPETPPTATVIPPTATATPIPCNWAELVSNVTIPLDAALPIGGRFTKIWRVMNVGSCSWVSGYALVSTGGNPMGAVTMIPLTSVIQPGETIDLSAAMTVPGNPASYQSNWMLRTPSGNLFGIGPDSNDPLTVRVQAYRPTVNVGYALNFALDFCAADWQNADGRLTCPGGREDPNGAALVLDRPILESGRADGLVLWTRPETVQNGWINGQFPQYTIRENDRFLAQIGCLADSPGCDITFQLVFQTFGGASRGLGSWREVFDGSLTNINIDLSPLVNIAGRFIFNVTSNGPSQTANAAWLNPRIENISTSSQLVMTWTREDGTDRCVRLEIHLTTPWTAEARAYPCAQANELGRASLTQDELSRLLDWYWRLDDFDGEIFQAAGGQPKVAWIRLYGQGTKNATNAEITSMNNFASVLLSRIQSQ